MNLWAIQIIRKSHSKEILGAKVVDVDTMGVNTFTEESLIWTISNLGHTINNLTIDNGRVVLTGYAKHEGAKMYMHRARSNDKLRESFIIALRGYNCVYDFIVDVPFHNNKALRMIGTVRDLEKTLDNYGIHWDGKSLYNGYVTNTTYAFKNNGQYKLHIYNQFNNSWGDLCNTELQEIAQIRESITAEFCQITAVNDLAMIDKVKFDKTVRDVEIPEGVSYFNKSLGGAYSIEFPETLKKLGRKCFTNDNDILQVSFKAPIKEIPALFASRSSLQIFDYDKDFDLETIDNLAFYDCEYLKSDLVSKVKYIEQGAFAHTEINKVVIRNCKKVGQKAFADCKKLSAVVLGENAHVYAQAFMNCSKLTDLVIGNASIIEEEAFIGCSKLVSVDLSGVLYISKGAFSKCNSLRSIILSKGATVEKGAIPSNVEIQYV